MTIPTEFVRDRALEIAFFMALPAAHFRMLSDQLKLRGVVVEIPAGTIVLPAAGVVTAVALAALLHFLERAVVLIGVTALAAVKRYSLIGKQPLDRLAVSAGTTGLYRAGACGIRPVVAFLTRNLLMLARERKGRARMVESGSRFPGGLVVAAETVGAEPILMRLLVAHSALASQAKE